MQVSDLFTRLSYGVFSNLAIGMEGAGDIAADKKPKIISYLNEALLKLHSRFLLKENDAIVLQSGGIRYYRLSSEFAVSNAAAPVGQIQYIIDTVEQPFKDDVIRILEVRDRLGCVLGLNDVEDPSSVFTPQPTVLQVPSAVTGEPLGLLYQARHPEIAIDGFDTLIDLPGTLEGALISYIAFLNFSHMNSQESASKAVEHMAMFEAACSEIEEKDLVNGAYAQTNTRFSKRGWI